jgi:Ca2+/H+ antiporter, TMEM165/GDT1 family
MEALVPAFLLALLSHHGDRPALAVARFADRFARPLLVATMAGLALTTGNILAALAGFVIAPMLNVHAQILMLAFALLSGGAGGLLDARLPDRFARWSLGPMLTPLLVVFTLAAGDRTQFFTLALGLGGLPWLAAAGATLGGFAACLVAALLGEAGWRAVRPRWSRVAVSVVLLIAGAWVALAALRLL